MVFLFMMYDWILNACLIFDWLNEYFLLADFFLIGIQAYDGTTF